MGKSAKFSPGVQERAVRLVPDYRSERGSQRAAIGSIVAKIGRTAETLRRWVRRAERVFLGCPRPAARCASNAASH